MSLSKATAGAITFSGFTLLLCLFGISSIYNEIRDIWSELDKEMDQFKLEADDLWRDMLTMGAGTPANRQRRQAAYEAAGKPTGPAAYQGPAAPPPSYPPPPSSAGPPYESMMGPGGPIGSPAPLPPSIPPSIPPQIVSTLPLNVAVPQGNGCSESISHIFIIYTYIFIMYLHYYIANLMAIFRL